MTFFTENHKRLKNFLKTRLVSWGLLPDQVLAVSAAAVSHQGRIRENNEDNLYFQGRILPEIHRGTEEEWGLSSGTALTAAVFDGMGGESAGELASYAAASCMKEIMKDTDGQMSPEDVQELCGSLNRRVLLEARQRKYSQIGTTAVMAFFSEETYLICNLGDSPAYLLRGGRLTMLSRPHTNEKLLREQGITDKKPGLTQFLGIDEEEFLLEPHTIQGKLQPGDVFLLCSDGLTDMVSENEITGILQKKGEPEQQIRRLLDRALEHGGRDNITIILCKVQWAENTYEGTKEYGQNQ